MQTLNLIQQISTLHEARNDTCALTMTTYPTCTNKININALDSYHGHHLACHLGALWTCGYMGMNLGGWGNP